MTSAWRSVAFLLPVLLACSLALVTAQTPSVQFSTPIDGAVIGRAVASDAAGNWYVVADRIDATPILDPARFGSGGNVDVYVAKFSPSGELRWSAIIGGRGNDIARALAVDAEGAVYLAGNTFSDNFPTTASAFKKGAETSGLDAFVCKLDPEGRNLLYSTLVSGDFGSQANGLAVDDRGQAVVVGGSALFPTTEGALLRDSPERFYPQGFLAKLDASGSRLVYATHFGGSSGATQISAVSLGGQGEILIAGNTDASDLPLAGPIQDRFESRTAFRFSGGAWKAIDGLPGARGVVSHPDGRAIYAGGPNVVYRSKDDGETWEKFPVVTDETKLQETLGLSPINAIGFDPADSSHMFASIFAEGVFHSNDGGVTWSRYMTGSGSRGLWVLGGNPFVLLVQRTGSLETYVDGRRLPMGALQSGLGLAVSSNPRVAYAVKQSGVGLLEGGLYRSETAGVWTWLGDSDFSISQLQIDPNAPSTMYALSSGGVKRTVDGGATWTLQNRGLPSHDVRFLALDPSASDVLWAATSTGIFRSSDRGETWESFAGRADNPDPTSLAISAIGSPLLFASAAPGPDGFVARLSQDGGSLLSSTYLGGAGSDTIVAISQTEDGDIVVGGSTTSLNFPVSPNALEPVLDGQSGGYLASLNSDASALKYATFLGSKTRTTLSAMAADSSGNTVAILQSESPVLVGFKPDGTRSFLPRTIDYRVDAFSLNFAPNGVLGILGVDQHSNRVTLVAIVP